MEDNKENPGNGDQQPKAKKSKKKLYALIGGGVGLLGLTAFGLWWFKWRNPQASQDENDLMYKIANKSHKHESLPNAEEETDKAPIPTPVPIPKKTPAKPQATFPLKKGQTSSLIKQLQEVLIKRYGANIFTGKKATGFYGDETARILKAKGLPAVIDKETFDKIISGQIPATQTASTPGTDKNKLFSTQAIDIAKSIWLCCSKRDLDGLIKQLERIKDVKQYITVNTLFKTIRTDGVRQTIVNAALSSFFLTTDKMLLNAQFERMGLKYDGNKWSLSGVLPQLITSRHTTIRNLEGIELDVPEQTMLGEHLAERNGLTEFRAIDGQVLYVPSRHVKFM